MTFKKFASLSLVLGFTFVSAVGCTSNNDTLATFNGGNITKEELTQEMNLDKLLFKLLQDTDLTDQEIKDQAKGIINQIFTYDMLSMEAKKMKLNISDSELQDTLEQLKAIYKENPDIQEAVKKAGFTDEEVKELIKRNLLANKYAEKIQKDIAISESDVEKYYEENKDSLYTPEYAEASHILIKTTDDEGNELPAKEKEKAKEKAEEVLKKVNAGEDFAKLAKEYSDDSSASEGGYLGRFYKGQMVKPFEDAAFGLEKGKTSGIVESIYGYHIIKLKDKGKETLAYNDIATQVRKDLFTARENDKFVQLNDKYNLRIDNKKLDSYLGSLKLVDPSIVVKEESSKKESSKNTTSTQESTNTTDKK